MTSYRQSRQRGQRSIVPKLLVVAFLVFLVGFGDRAFGGYLHSAARSVAAAAWSAADTAGTAITESGVLKSRSSLASENLALRDKLADQEALAQENQLLKTENNLLRELAGMAGADARDGGVAARVLSPANASPFSSFVLGAGANDGVQQGDVVVAPGSVLVGSVIDVNASQTLAQYVFAPGAEVSALIGAEKATVVLVGRGGGNALAEVPRGLSIVEGDMVMSGDGRFVLGTVGAVRAGDTDPVQTILVRTVLAPSSITLVRILH